MKETSSIFSNNIKKKSRERDETDSGDETIVEKSRDQKVSRRKKNLSSGQKLFLWEFSQVLGGTY